MLVNEAEVETGFPDVPVELVVLTPLTTITGDGAVSHLVERVGDVELSFVDVHFLLAVVVKVVVAFNLFLGVVVVVVLDELVLLNLVVVVDDLYVFFVVDVFLDVVVPLFSADVVVKDVVVEQFCQRTFVEQLVGGNVVFDAVLPIVLLDVEHDVGVELCEFHSLDVRSCCARCCCRSSFHICCQMFCRDLRRR